MTAEWLCRRPYGLKNLKYSHCSALSEHACRLPNLRRFPVPPCCVRHWARPARASGIPGDVATYSCAAISFCSRRVGCGICDTAVDLRVLADAVPVLAQWCPLVWRCLWRGFALYVSLVPHFYLAFLYCYVLAMSHKQPMIKACF